MQTKWTTSYRYKRYLLKLTQRKTENLNVSKTMEEAELGVYNVQSLEWLDNG